MKKNTPLILVLLWINIGSIHSLTVRPMVQKLTVPRTNDAPSRTTTTTRRSSSPTMQTQTSYNAIDYRKSTSKTRIIDSILPIGSAALLITSNTVGAGMMTLPQLAVGPGILATSGLMLGTYILNLISGLLIAEVSINQYESSDDALKNVPSSFKELTDVNFESLQVGTFVSTVSIFINSCVLSYGLSKAGEMICSMTGITEDIGLIGAAMTLVTIVGTQDAKNLSYLASGLCFVLFASFAALIVPSLTAVQHPFDIFMTPGTSAFGTDSFYEDLSTFFPVLLTTMVYQNIVPTITKMLKYDRSHVIAALGLGSMIPMIMYLMFCFTVLGSGSIGSLGSESVYFQGIAISSVIGSSMSCSISIGEEWNVFLDETYESSPQLDDADKEGKNQSLALKSTILGILPPLFVALTFGQEHGLVGALSISGTYATPILYFLIPVLLAFTQRTGILEDMKSCRSNPEKMKLIGERIGCNDLDTTKHLVPGGFVSIVGLAGGTGSLLASSLIHDVSSFIPFV